MGGHFKTFNGARNTIDEGQKNTRKARTEALAGFLSPVLSTITINELRALLWRGLQRGGSAICVERAEKKML